MNEYTKNLNRIEFIITYDCTGKCKHCSVGDITHRGIRIDSEKAQKLIFDVASKYCISSVMTFGGEPLLHPECVCAIHSAAKTAGITKRQIITNGFFSKNPAVIKEVADKISKCGANDILLSVDAFHQETIPLEPVKIFASEIQKSGVPIKTSPAWLAGREDNNPYNVKTREILKIFEDMGIEEASGNVIFPSGNAIKYLSEYFDSEHEYINPYEEDPQDIKSISIEPDGTVLDKNIYTEDIIHILDTYSPAEGVF